MTHRACRAGIETEALQTGSCRAPASVIFAGREQLISIAHGKRRFPSIVSVLVRKVTCAERREFAITRGAITASSTSTSGEMTSAPKPTWCVNGDVPAAQRRNRFRGQFPRSCRSHP